jgi:hypothetical protein
MFFSIFDGLKGFHQLELDMESRKLTTFTTPLGRFRYCRMPMGWHGSSDLFNERMRRVFGKLKWCHRIVEDLLIASPTWEQHVEDVAEVLRLATDNNVSFNAAKTQFGQTAVKFGGFCGVPWAPPHQQGAGGRPAGVSDPNEDRTEVLPGPGAVAQPIHGQGDQAGGATKGAQ